MSIIVNIVGRASTANPHHSRRPAKGGAPLPVTFHHPLSINAAGRPRDHKGQTHKAL
ncbi:MULTISPECIES: hypothetical protein [unclassified Amycolatopsis]|uniref:hypothetical protein n=1 Tax=unclassified Amycolatopsis TaxID=2618356 RepID=UPI002E1DCA27|nr:MULTISPECIES: hypothetical protein [unclassified Amycolatopsis]